ncbi:unnamed protein product [Diamesa hyperborea]
MKMSNKQINRKVFLLLLFSGCVLILYASYVSDQSDLLHGLPLIENDTMIVCKDTITKHAQTQQESRTTEITNEKTLPIIYFVTPTYPRREQIPELLKLGQTLMHVENLVWILADDSDTCNPVLDNLLDTFGIPFLHLSSPMPFQYRAHKTIPRGVSNRRAALQWIAKNNIIDGVLYFGDDDNSFSLKLFSEIRTTKKVSMFPVGLIGLYSVSSPIVENGRVVGFFDSWLAKRKWPVDMAGFAVGLRYLADFPNASMPYKAGYEEDSFLKSIGLKIEEIEPKGNNCTEVLVWHTQTSKTKAPTIKVSDDVQHNINKSNLKQLLKHLDDMGVSHTSANGGVKAAIRKDGKSKTISS